MNTQIQSYKQPSACMPWVSANLSTSEIIFLAKSAKMYTREYKYVHSIFFTPEFFVRDDDELIYSLNKICMK